MKTAIAMASAILALTACGGGGGDDNGSSSNAPSATAAGQYNGTVNGRQATVTVLDNGRFYTQYSLVGSNTVLAGVVAGTVSSSSGKIQSGSGFDYNLEGAGVQSVSISGNYAAKQSLSATVTYTNGGKSSFTGSYDSTYDTTPTQAAVTGTFTGTSVTVLGSDTATLSVDGNGVISGSGTNCPFTGTIKPHATGNVYDVTITFAAGSGCAYPGSSATGIGLLNGSGGIRALLQTPSNAGVLFIGSK